MLILTDAQCKSSDRDAQSMKKRIEAKRRSLHSEGKNALEVKRLIEAEWVFMSGICEDVEFYRCLKDHRKPLPPVTSDNLGLLLIYCRIRSGKTQEEFAALRRTSVEQVIRDERNEYHQLNPSMLEYLIDQLGFSVEALQLHKAVKKR
jgi:hypothetical protein